MKKIYQTFFLSFAYTIILNIMITSATIFLHEFSHFLAAVFLACDEIKVVSIEYPQLTAYTEARCEPQTPYIFLAMSPLILITFFSASFLLLKKMPEKHFFWSILGFNLIVSLADILKFVPNFFFYLTSAVGLILVVFGQFLFINEILSLFLVERGEEDDF